jgi:hypothetical protein
MTVIVKHNKTNSITDWTQAQLDEQIALGNFAPGTLLADIVLPSDWNNDHTLTGLGTMAEQDATAVAITGGTINNTTIGATTATTGKFTSVTTPSVTATTTDLTLSAISTGAVKFNTAGGLQAQVANLASSDIYLQLRGGVGAVTRPSFGTVLTTANSAGFNIYNSGQQPIRFQTNGNGVDEQFVVAHTNSPVNYVQVTGGATGTYPAILGTGSDGTVGLQLAGKGGTIDFRNNGIGTATQFSVAFTASSVNYLNATGSGVTGNAPRLFALGTDTNISMAFQPKGTGAIDLAAGSSGVNISNGGTVTAITRTAGGSGYATAPTVAISAPTTAGGVQATATCTVTAGAVNTTFTITNAGSGYIEQPTITFSGGGGSGAAAYATVGSVPIVKTIASALSFTTPSSEVFRIVDANSTGQNYISLESSGGGSNFRNAGAGTNLSTYFISKGTGTISFATNASTSTEQLRISHTASAVNYVQVTGAATTGRPVIQVAGSDTNIGITYTAKGTGIHAFGNGNGTQLVLQAGSTSSVNRLEITPTVTGSAPILSAGGTDTDIDLALTPKGTGNVRFGTYTGTILTPTGFITIKDSGGTTRRLLVG